MKQPLAYVDPEAKIADNVIIDPFVTIEKDVVIEEGSHIYAHATICEGARIGKNCRIFPGAVIAGIPQDLKFRGEKTEVFIGDNTTVRECATINRGTASKGVTKVGSNCLIMAYVHIAHDCVVGNNCIIVNACQIAGEVEIDDYAIIGGSSAVHQFSRIGKHAMIQGGSLVGKDVPPFARAARLPISFSGINTVGLHRRGFTADQISQIQEIYKILYQSGLNISAAVAHIEEVVPASPERDEIVNFVKSSKRGIMKGYRAGDSKDED